nr:MAG TPA: hypothetical protein [Caudoviricetes sp.]
MLLCFSVLSIISMSQLYKLAIYSTNISYKNQHLFITFYNLFSTDHFLHFYLR